MFLVPITPQTSMSNGPPSRCGLPCRATSRESKGSSFIAGGLLKNQNQSQNQTRTWSSPEGDCLHEGEIALAV